MAVREVLILGCARQFSNLLIVLLLFAADFNSVGAWDHWDYTTSPSPTRGLYTSTRGPYTSTREPYTPDSSRRHRVVTTEPVLPEESDKQSLYLKGILGELRNDDLEYALDYYNEKPLIEELDFESTVLAKQLADAAISHNTTPEEFQGEIRDLITLQNRSRAGQGDTSSRDETNDSQEGLFSESMKKRMAEGWKTELKRLEKKYNVSSEPGPGAVTAARLSLMFPHYLNFSQKPFAAPSNISLDILKTNVYDSGYYRLTEYKLPSFFGRHEFGGVIPRYDRFLKKMDRRAIIVAHLYALYWRNQNDMVPFRTKCALLKRRMDKSVLTEERRVRFLVNNDVVNGNGTLISTLVKNASDRVPRNFTDKIDWSLLDVVAESNQRNEGSVAIHDLWNL